MWAPKGEQPQIPMTSTHQKAKLFGTVNPLIGESFCHHVEDQGAEAFKLFLEEILNRYSYKEHITIYLDNFRTHHALLLQSFLNEHADKLELIFLPPYSPNLNLMERVWRFIRKIVSHNTFFETFKKFLDALYSVIKKIANPSETIHNLCGNF